MLKISSLENLPKFVDGFCPRCGLVKVSAEESVPGGYAWWCESCDDCGRGVSPRLWFHYLLTLFVRKVT